jgi:hypothetical protein
MFGNRGSLPTQEQGQDTWVCSFTNSGASYLDPAFFTAPIVGAGVGYNQTSGALNITTGIGTNAEFLTRSSEIFSGAMRLRASVVASQRIANQNLAILLADLVGEGLAYNIVNSTTLDVTLPAHRFTAVNVGQSMHIGGITGAAGVPGRYAIASIPNANTIRFTVAAWPASGTGTLTLFAWNYVRNLLTGTTATSINFDAQRNGWNTGDTVGTVNTTASPGTIIQNDLTGRDVFFSDTLRATSTAPTVTTRASRVEAIPDVETGMYIFIWSFNGSTAPASTTTWTIGFLSLERFANQGLFLQGVRAQGSQNPLPVSMFNTPTLGAGSNLVGDVAVQYRPTASGLNAGGHVVSAASTNATNLKASAGKVFGWCLANNSASWRYVKLHNSATAPTAGAGVARTIPISPNGMSVIYSEGGITFSAGIGYTTVTGAADADGTPVGANEIVGELFFA